MIPELRKQYNETFTRERYEKMLDSIAAKHGHRPPFPVAETPVFVPNDLKAKLFQACEEITDVICRPDFKELSKNAIPPMQEVPNETDHTTFLQMDFGICLDENGEYTPQLIEVQGFPSLYFFQDLVAHSYKEHLDIPAPFSHLFGGINSDQYHGMLRDAIVGDHDPENVILLEVEPRKQVTEIDFIAAKHSLGINYCCVSDLKVEGKDVYYINDAGKKTKVERIYNRVIFDELVKREDLKREFYLSEEHNVEWAGHPNWFFRISKHTLPLIKSEFVPKSHFLNELVEIPDDLSKYVLKPLYSFAGTGVVINLSRYDIEAIKDPENYIIQQKVDYAPVISTPNEPAKCEIRMLMLWEPGASRPRMVNNLARLSKGQMVGVRYNKGKDWVGGSVGFFEPEAKCF